VNAPVPVNANAPVPVNAPVHVRGLVLLAPAFFPPYHSI